jgi:hypothetical protein
VKLKEANDASLRDGLMVSLNDKPKELVTRRNYSTPRNVPSARVCLTIFLDSCIKEGVSLCLVCSKRKFCLMVPLASMCV